MILLEDNRRKSEYSVFLDSVYGRDNVVFTVGSGNLSKVIRRYINSDKEIFVYVDVVPDNINTLNIFSSLLVEFGNFKNVYILPVFCSEYIILRYLQDTVELDELYKSILNLKVNYKLIKEFEDCVNFEKVCKRILSLVEKDYRDLLKNVSIRISIDFVLKYQYFDGNDIMERYYSLKNCNNLECISFFIKQLDTLSNAIGISLNKCSSYKDIKKFVFSKRE